MGGDGVAGGHINAQRNGQRFKPRCQSHPVSAIGIVLPDRRDRPHLKVDRVPGRHCTDLLQRAADGIRRQRKIFQRSVQVHRRPIIQSYHGGHQHTALQHKLVFAGRSRQPDQQPLEHIVLQNHLSRNIFLPGNVADPCLQTHGVAHKSTSKYRRRTEATRIRVA